MATSQRPGTRRGSRPAPRPTHAAQIIWNGSHGPTPAVISAEANSEVTPSTKPKPGPKTRPARISRKNTSSMPAAPAESTRMSALTAARTPRMREHPRVDAALAELGDDDGDHHGNEQQEQERRTDLVTVLDLHEQRPAQHHQPGERGDAEHPA